MPKDENKFITRTMPNSADAEKACLAAMMMDSEICATMCAMLDENCFYTQRYKIVFKAIQEINSRNVPSDIIAVSSYLSKNNTISLIGGMEGLIDIAECIPSTTNYRHFMNTVLETAKFREIINCCNGIISYCYDTNDSAQKAIAYAQSEIFSISDGKTADSLRHASESVPEVVEKLEGAYRRKGALMGICTHFKNIDNITNGFLPGQMIVIAARPGVGKTSFVINVVDNIAKYEKKERTVAIFNLEMSSVELVQRMVMHLGALDMQLMLSGKEPQEDLKKVWSASTTINNSNVYIDDTGTITPEEIASKCRRLKMKKGLDLVVIDYLQLMKCSKDFRGNKQAEVEELSRQMKLMAKDLKVPVIVLSQMSRDIEKRSTTNFKNNSSGQSEDVEPVLADLRGSGAIEQDADMVAFLDSDKSLKWGNEQCIKFIIAKHRSGPLDTLYFAFVKNKMQFNPVKDKFYPKKEVANQEDTAKTEQNESAQDEVGKIPDSDNYYDTDIPYDAVPDVEVADGNVFDNIDINTVPPAGDDEE